MSGHGFVDIIKNREIKKEVEGFNPLCRVMGLLIFEEQVNKENLDKSFNPLCRVMGLLMKEWLVKDHLKLMF